MNPPWPLTNEKECLTPTPYAQPRPRNYASLRVAAPALSQHAAPPVLTSVKCDKVPGRVHGSSHSCSAPVMTTASSVAWRCTMSRSARAEAGPRGILPTLRRPLPMGARWQRRWQWPGRCGSAAVLAGGAADGHVNVVEARKPVRASGRCPRFRRYKTPIRALRHRSRSAPRSTAQRRRHEEGRTP